MTQIDYFTFPISPFCYLAGMELEDIAARHDATIRYIPFGLLKVFEATGTPPPKERHPSRQAYRMQELSRVAAFRNMPINPNPAFWPTNPVPAMSAMIAASEAGGGDLGGLVHGLSKACWAEEKDISDDAVIADCLTAHGFDPKIALAGMLTGSETIERNTTEALDRGVFGAPTYLVDDQIFWGQDRLAYLDAYLTAR